MVSSDMDTGNRTILVVDDNEPILRVLEMGLREYGYKILAAVNAGKALNIANKKKFQFALIDICLPDMNGIDLSVEIRKYNPGVIVIFITGYPGIKSSIEALRHHAYDYLIKPFKIIQIVTIIERARKELQLRYESQSSLEIIQKLKEENKQLKGMLEDLIPAENRIHVKSDKYNSLQVNKEAVLRSYQKNLLDNVSEKKDKISDRKD
ncbi:MAG: response regulator [Candidatus Marinimicrobia bacterium]|nr:response regulator [Candidatus Neomarinimicrobiota bacterium]MCK4447801.1 response regulator [Candidatus Neomarinimicrobiota bacterium]